MGVLYGANQGKGITSTSTGEKEALDVNLAISTGGGTGGGGGGGGAATFFAKPTGYSGADAVSAYASATSLTVTGLSFAFGAGDIVSIIQIPNAGGTGTQTTTYSDVADFSVSALSSGSQTITVTGATFAATDVFVVTIASQIKGFSPTSNSNRSEEINPPDQKYVEEELIDTTNVSAATNYYPSSDGLTMDGYNGLDIQGVISGGVTATIEATLDDASSPDFVDVTKAGYDLITNTANNASFVDTNFLLSYDNFRVKKVRVKSVTSDASNGVQYHIKRTVLS